jgi:hypothetical protein
MIEIEAAKNDLKKLQKKQSKALARLEEQNTTLHTLEACLEELRAQNPQAATGTEPISLPGKESRLPDGLVVMIDAAKMDALP